MLTRVPHSQHAGEFARGRCRGRIPRQTMEIVQRSNLRRRKQVGKIRGRFEYLFVEIFFFFFKRTKIYIWLISYLIPGEFVTFVFFLLRRNCVSILIVNYFKNLYPLFGNCHCEVFQPCNFFFSFFINTKLGCFKIKQKFLF